MRQAASGSPNSGSGARTTHVSSRVTPFADVVVLLGSCWLLLEYQLRGGAGTIRWQSEWSTLMAALCCMVGLAIRPRATFVGEGRIALEMIRFSSIGIFLLPAAFLLYYLVALFSSVVMFGGAWGVWLGQLLIAALAQIIVWGLLCGGGIVCIVGGVQRNGVTLAAGAGAVVGGALATLAANWFFELKTEQTLLAGIVSKAFDNTKWIQSWHQLFDLARRVFSDFDQARIISLFVSVASGIALGTVASIGARLGRQRLMETIWLRGYLPLAAAPLADAVPIVNKEVAPALIAYLVVAWTSVLWCVL